MIASYGELLIKGHLGYNMTSDEQKEDKQKKKYWLKASG